MVDNIALLWPPKENLVERGGGEAKKAPIGTYKSSTWTKRLS